MNVCYKWVIGFCIAFSFSAAQAQAVHGVLRVVKGDVQIKSGKSGQTARARVGEKVFPKDTVITAKEARAKIVMIDNNEINVSPESQVEIQNYEYDPAAGKKDVLLNVIYGKVRSKVEQKYDGKTSKFQIKTPSAVAGVRGTDFLTGFQGGITNVVTFEGRVEFGPPGPNGAIMNPMSVTPGMTATIAVGGVVTPPVVVPTADLAKMDGETRADGPNGPPGPGGNPNQGPRGPASQDNKGKGPGPGPGGCSMCGGGPGDGPGGDQGHPPPPPPPPPPLPPEIKNFVPEAVRDVTSGGNTKLKIIVNTPAQ